MADETSPAAAALQMRAPDHAGGAPSLLLLGNVAAPSVIVSSRPGATGGDIGIVVP